MNTVYLENDGVINLSAITTFGVNVKESDNPFGFFGTGMKYALAILLRENHKITIYAGEEKHEFTTIEKIIREKPFNIICLDGRELGFTLDLGKTWKMWQAYRELYCNTLDEEGVVSTDSCEPAAGRTLIVVEGKEFFECHIKRDTIILRSTPKYQEASVDIHEGVSSHMHMNTIRVRDLLRPSIFTYNMTSKIDLTEDRTAKYDFQPDGIVRLAVLHGENVEFITAFITAPEDTYEQELNCDQGDQPGDVFMATVKAIGFKDITNASILSLYKKNTEKKKVPLPATMTDVEKTQLQRAIDFCNGLDYDVEKHPINVTDDLNPEVLGCVYLNEIYLSRRVFQQGTKQVAATLLEEHMHIEYKYADNTYRFQTYLFDVIITLGERLKGEPL